MSGHAKIVLLGHSEAGSAVAGELVAGPFDVVGFNPGSKVASTARVAGSLEDAMDGAAVILALGSTVAPTRIAEQVAPLLGKNAVYADLGPGVPSLKKDLAMLFEEGSFVDAAVLGKDDASAEVAALEVAGAGARKLIELLEPSGLRLEYVSEVPGEATARRLIRSLFAKGIAGVITDTLWAAENMGMHTWAYQEILETFEASSAETAQQYLSGTAQHIKRRQIEIMDVVSMLNETGYESTMLAGIEFNYGRILHGKKIPFSKRP